MDDLTAVLKQHAAWLRGEGGGKRANLNETNLSRVNLRDVDLRDANLSRVDLREADLRDADLSGANLRRADLRDANLSRAYLNEADLREADLSGANLRRANLSRANLSRAGLSGASIEFCDRLIDCSLGNYAVVAYMQDGELYFTSGCRQSMTLDEARAHWSPDNVDRWTRVEPEWGAQRLRQIEFLAAEARHLGWMI